MDHQAYYQALAASLQGSELAFPVDEFEGRLVRARDAMHREGVDALLLTSPADIFYLCGYHTFEVSVHAALVVTAHRTLLQVASIETGPAVVTARVDEVVGYRWEMLDEVIAPLADALSDCRSVAIDGVSSGLRHGVMRPLQSRLGGERFHDRASALMAGLRLVKSDRELDCLAHSARLSALGLAAAIDVIRPGISDNEVAAEGARAMLAAGSEFFSLAPIVTAGARSGVIHVNHKRHEIKQGESVFLEFGAVWQRYTAPIMRTVSLGPPSREMQAAADLCQRLEQTLCDAMRPGVAFEEVAELAQREFDAQGNELFHSGVFGYSVGAQFPPSWVEGTGYIARGQKRRLADNMVFHLPLCLRLPGRWGVGLSNTVKITARGAVPITEHDGRLLVLRQEAGPSVE
ncbi:M24 family metallopeptidase [Halomonas sp. V046]|uniref:M24 family metallopeptidase n=1 Tax=Halomonas sp. V046 TaxID=3459611 RepID=UPI0040447406